MLMAHVCLSNRQNMSTTVGPIVAEKLPATFTHQIPPSNVDFAVQGVEALYAYIDEYKGENAVHLRSAGMKALLNTIPPDGKMPSWPDMPTIFAVAKPKETFWVWAMSEFGSPYQEPTPRLRGLSGVIQLQALVWDEVMGLYASSGHEPLTRLYNICHQWWLNPKQLVTAPSFLPRIFASVGRVPINARSISLRLAIRKTPSLGCPGLSINLHYFARK